MPETFIKFWRLAADPYEPPPSSYDALERQEWVKHAENAMRDALDAGDDFRPVLVAPELGSVAELANGRVRDVCAWRYDGPSVAFGTTHTPFPYVVAFLDADDVVPDARSELFADNGSVFVRRGHVTRLHLCVPTLRSVAHKLADRYEVGVTIANGDANLPPIDIKSARPVLLRQALGLSDIEAARAHFTSNREPQLEDSAGPRTAGRGVFDFASCPPSLSSNVQDVAVRVAGGLGLPISGDVRVHLAGYSPGSEHLSHKDRNRGEPFSYHRTVSVSLLLSEPGVDFEGGELEVDGTIVGDLHAGDAVGFTSETYHRVRPVTAGYRLVLICFAHCWR